MVYLHEGDLFMDKNPQAAIYKLKNEITGDFYVGGTRCVQRRHRQHMSDFRLNKHRNPKMQNDYNIGHTFKTIILEELDQSLTDDAIIRREQQWMDMLSPVYNTKNAAPSRGSDLEISRERKLAGHGHRVPTDEDRIRRGKSVKKYWEEHEHFKHTEEEKRNISIAVSGKNHPNYGRTTPDTVKNKIADTVSKVIYTFTSPDGGLVQFKNLHGWCKENNLSESCVRDVRKGNRKQYKGWKFISAIKIIP